LAEAKKGPASTAPAAAEGRAVQTVVFRCIPCLAFWAAATAAAICATPLFDLEIDTSIAALIVAAYCAQALLMDLAGVRVDGAGVRAPFRPWPEIPVAVFGRRTFRFEHIERVVVVRRGLLVPAIVRTKTRTTCGLVFSSKDARRTFYRRVADLRPFIPVVKST
jgi:hypothetical protein